MTQKLATAYNTIGILYGREEPGKINSLVWDDRIRYYLYNVLK